MSVTLGDGPKGGPYSRDKQARWLQDNNMFVKSIGQKLDCEPDDLLMITAMWMPPFNMMVKRYCGKRTRDDLERSGKPLPFPGKEFHVWDISLHNFAHVAAYLASHPVES
jgi:hypothetical protein